MVHLTHSTKSIKAKNIEANWYLIDAKGKTLGKIATEAAVRLMGKHKTTYASYLDSGDNVVVINALDVVVTGSKEENKVYDNYSGYPGGLKKVTFKKMKLHNPTYIIRHAVSGMLQKNKLRDPRLARLFIYKDSNHPYSHKFTK